MRPLVLLLLLGCAACDWLSVNADPVHPAGHVAARRGRTTATSRSWSPTPPIWCDGRGAAGARLPAGHRRGDRPVAGQVEAAAGVRQPGRSGARPRRHRQRQQRRRLRNDGRCLSAGGPADAGRRSARPFSPSSPTPPPKRRCATGWPSLLPLPLEMRRGGIRAAIAACRTRPRPRVLIVDITGEEQPLTALEQLADVVEPDVVVLVVGEIERPRLLPRGHPRAGRRRISAQAADARHRGPAFRPASRWAKRRPPTESTAAGW